MISMIGRATPGPCCWLWWGPLGGQQCWLSWDRSFGRSGSEPLWNSAMPWWSRHSCQLLCKQTPTSSNASPTPQPTHIPYPKHIDSNSNTKISKVSRNFLRFSLPLDAPKNFPTSVWLSQPKTGHCHGKGIGWVLGSHDPLACRPFSWGRRWWW